MIISLFGIFCSHLAHSDNGFGIFGSSGPDLATVLSNVVT